jgi:hypothetical protein
MDPRCRKTRLEGLKSTLCDMILRHIFGPGCKIEQGQGNPQECSVSRQSGLSTVAVWQQLYQAIDFAFCNFVRKLEAE